MQTEFGIPTHDTLTPIVRIEEMGMRPGSPRAASRRTTRFVVRQRNRIYLIRHDEVDWLEAAGNYVRLHTMKGEFLIRKTLREIEESIDANEFARIHRSTIVNLNRVAEITPGHYGDYDVTLTTGKRLRLSRHYRSRVID